MNDDQTEIFVLVPDGESEHSVVVENDGKAVYAYLRHHEVIQGYVWLYNCAPPGEDAWDDPEDMPFANLLEYVKDEDPPLVQRTQDLSCHWKYEPDGDLAAVDLLIHGQLYARLTPGSKPGWSRLARTDGPVAQVLSE